MDLYLTPHGAQTTSLTTKSHLCHLPPSYFMCHFYHFTCGMSIRLLFKPKFNQINYDISKLIKTTCNSSHINIMKQILHFEMFPSLNLKKRNIETHGVVKKKAFKRGKMRTNHRRLHRKLRRRRYLCGDKSLKKMQVKLDY